MSTSEDTDIDSINVTMDVEGIDPGIDQRRVLDLYQTNAQTFLRKNEDYGSSFVTSGMIVSLYESGEIVPETVIENIAQQLFVRMQDKQARIYQQLIADTDQHVADEDVLDTLLDLANYSIMLASQLVKYEEGGFPGQHPELEALNDLTTADEQTLTDVVDRFGEDLHSHHGVGANTEPADPIDDVIDSISTDD